MRFAVIGAKRGLGLALTQRLLAEGHKVAAGVRERDVPESLKALASQYGDKLLVGPADVTSEDDIKFFAETVAAFMGNVDVLCVVAGVIMPGDRAYPLHMGDVSEIPSTFAVNTLGPIIAVKYFYPVMEKGGKVLIITSEGVGVRNAYSGIPGYALSKTAATKVSGILTASANDVDFYSVHPGRPLTDMNQNGEISAEESADGIYRIMAGITPVSRKIWYIDYMGNPMEM